MLAANRACSALFGSGVVGSNMIRSYFAEPRPREAIANWPDVAWAALARLRKQARVAPFDDELRDLVDLAETTLGSETISRAASGEHDIVVCPWFRVGDEVLRTIGIAARFDTAHDVTLDEIRIELLYPLDEVAERFFAAGTTSARAGGP